MIRTSRRLAHTAQGARRIAYHGFLPLTVVASLLAGCGGNSSPASVAPMPPPVQNTSVTILVSSTANDQVAQANLSFTSLVLTDAMGGAVKVLSSPKSAEFMHLNGPMESLVTVDVPQGVYTAATAALGNSNFACVALTSSGGISAGTTTLVSATPTVTLPAQISISGTHVNLVLNLQVSASQSYSACSALYAAPPLNDGHNVQPTEPMKPI